MDKGIVPLAWLQVLRENSRCLLVCSAMRQIDIRLFDRSLKLESAEASLTTPSLCMVRTLGAFSVPATGTFSPTKLDKWSYAANKRDCLGFSCFKTFGVFFGSKLERGASHAITNLEPDVNNHE